MSFNYCLLAQPLEEKELLVPAIHLSLNSNPFSAGEPPWSSTRLEGPHSSLAVHNYCTLQVRVWL